MQQVVLAVADLFEKRHLVAHPWLEEHWCHKGHFLLCSWC
jgi:hypothetical protein